MDLRTLHIGQKIKKIRELKNLTQTYLARELGITQSAYSKIEMGETEVTYGKLEKISETLGIKPEEIIAFNESMVFNVMHNQNGGNVFSQIHQNNLSDNERKLYQDQIDLLKEELVHLKEILNKTMK
jgi:transcriptional regulator with XRE-family HTH domain